MTKTLFYSLLAAALALTLPLSACGVKPNSVDAPPGAENEKFPRIYPPPSEK